MEEEEYYRYFGKPTCGDNHCPYCECGYCVSNNGCYMDYIEEQEAKYE